MTFTVNIANFGSKIKYRAVTALSFVLLFEVFMKKNRMLLWQALSDEINNCYHNATPNYPRYRNEKEAEDFQAWFDMQAECAFEDLCGDIAEVRKFDYHVRFYLNRIGDQIKQRRSKILVDEWAVMYWYLSYFGPVNAYGRGGRTICFERFWKAWYYPAHLLQEYLGLSYKGGCDTLLALRKFNQFVRNWNDNVADWWEDEKRDNNLNYEEYDNKHKRQRILTEWI